MEKVNVSEYFPNASTGMALIYTVTIHILTTLEHARHRITVKLNILELVQAVETAEGGESSQSLLDL